MVVFWVIYFVVISIIAIWVFFDWICDFDCMEDLAEIFMNDKRAVHTSKWWIAFTWAAILWPITLLLFLIVSSKDIWKGIKKVGKFIFDFLLFPIRFINDAVSEKTIEENVSDIVKQVKDWLKK